MREFVCMQIAYSRCRAFSVPLGNEKQQEVGSISFK